jgi:hypothetical protein
MEKYAFFEKSKKNRYMNDTVWRVATWSKRKYCTGNSFQTGLYEYLIQKRLLSHCNDTESSIQERKIVAEIVPSGWLNQKYPERWIGRNGPRFPNLNPSNFLWRHLKQPADKFGKRTGRVVASSAQRLWSFFKVR